MTTPAWTLDGQYHETCNCDFVCPCILGQMAAPATHDDCTFAMAFRIDRGRYGAVVLDGLGFIVIGRTPKVMSQGNWSVGLVVDDRATTEQRDAIAAIAGGGAGGPMGAIAGLVGNFLGVESAPIRFERSGVSWAVAASPLVDMAAAGVMGVNPANAEPLYLDNTGHPASDRLALCHATKSHVHAFGVSWDDVSGRNNGHYAPFSWQGA
jgi:hypothetical protein